MVLAADNGTETEVAVVGAGPAGMSAACAAARSGCAVTIVDAYARHGGQYYKQMPAQFRARSAGALHHDFSHAEQLISWLEGDSRVTFLSGANVWSAQASAERKEITLYIERGNESSTLRAQRLILATGAYDRALPFPGWDLPGVMTAGAMQTLVKSQRVLPGRRIVLSGSGPFLMPVAAALAEGGAQVVGVYEATHPRQWAKYAAQVWGHWGKLREAQEYLRLLRKYRVPVRFGRAVVRADGVGRVERVVVARLAADWSPVRGSQETAEVDAVGVGYGFAPSTEIAQLLGCTLSYDPMQAASFVQHSRAMESSRRGVYVAGEITGIGGSAVARPQGIIAGLAAAHSLGHISTAQARSEIAPYRKELYQQMVFARLLRQLYAVRDGWKEWLRDDTTICRCEEVSYGQLKEAVTQHHASDVKTVKSLTRCGMGLCQGRVCGPNVAALTASLIGRSPEEVGSFGARPIVKPVLLGVLVADGG